jgi:hypothetical protein
VLVVVEATFGSASGRCRPVGRRAATVCSAALGDPVGPVGGLGRFVLVVGAERDVVEHTGEHQRARVTDLEELDVDGDDRDLAVEQADDVEEPGGDVLGDDDRDVLVLGVAAPFVVPVLDGADDVRLVGRAELELDLVAGVGLGVVQQQVETPGGWLPPLESLTSTSRGRAASGPSLIRSCSHFSDTVGSRAHVDARWATYSITAFQCLESHNAGDRAVYTRRSRTRSRLGGEGQRRCHPGRGPPANRPARALPAHRDRLAGRQGRKGTRCSS